MKKEEETRLTSNIVLVILLTALVLISGVLGYYIFEHPNWVMAFYDAASVMSVVGSNTPPETTSGKIFGGIYSLTVGLGYAIFIAYIFTSVLEKK